jgi:pimeloyl-ACP methyl ester carboxylesterase
VAYTDPGPARSFKLRTARVIVQGTVQTHYYHLRAPAAYGADMTKSYPLVVYLHQWGPDNAPERLADDRPIETTPEEIRNLPGSDRTPCFVYVPVCPPPYSPSGSLSAPQGGEWNSPAAKAMVVATIQDLMGQFNIDEKRIYLVGFSMGGAGCWYLGREYLRATGWGFAALCRGTGWYLDKDPQREEIHRALSGTPAWIHVGETEGEGYAVAMDNYRYFKSYFAKDGAESTEDRAVGQGLVALPGEAPPLRSKLYRLPLASGAEMRLSVYQNRDHENLMFRNADLFDWLFAQHL